MTLFSLSLTFCLLLASNHLAQTNSPVEGVWRVTEWTENGKTNTNPQPGLIIFTKGYYSVAMLMGEPRTDSIPSNMGREVPDAEKIGLYEQWKWFVGISGNYEVKGSAVVMHPMVAKTTWDMNRHAARETEFKFDGISTLWLTPKTKAAIRIKLTRLE